MSRPKTTGFFMKLQVSRVHVDDVISVDMNRTLARSVGGIINVDYPYPSYVSLTKGKQEYVVELLNSKIPNEIIIGLVEDMRYNGHNTENPFNFAHHNVESIQMEVDTELYPCEPLKMNYANKSYMKAYDFLFRQMGQHNKPDSCGLAYDDIAGGNAIYVFNLRPNPYNVQSVQPAGRTGIVTLKIKFSENLPNTLNVITVRAYNSAIYVDERRNFTGTLLTH